MLRESQAGIAGSLLEFDILRLQTSDWFQDGSECSLAMQPSLPTNNSFTYYLAPSPSARLGPWKTVTLPGRGWESSDCFDLGVGRIEARECSSSKRFPPWNRWEMGQRRNKWSWLNFDLDESWLNQATEYDFVLLLQLLFKGSIVR